MTRVRIVVFLCCFAGPTSVWADAVFTVNLDTSQLKGHAAGPFVVAFQLSDGSGLGDSTTTVAITEIRFGGGGVVGTPGSIGGAVGDLSSAVVLTDNAFINFFLQQFVPGNTLTFRVALQGVPEGFDTPDHFSFAVLDRTGSAVPTQGGAFQDVFVAADNSPIPSVTSFGGDPDQNAVAGGGSLTMPAPQVVVLGASDIKRSVLNDLSSLRSQITDKKDGNQLDDAIKHLARSLTSALWSDQNHLQSDEEERVFDEEEDATNTLSELIKERKNLLPEAPIRRFMEGMAQADRLLATVAIAEALQGSANAKLVALSNDELARGDVERARGNFEGAIERYKNAWKHAHIASRKS